MSPWLGLKIHLGDIARGPEVSGTHVSGRWGWLLEGGSVILSWESRLGLLGRAVLLESPFSSRWLRRVTRTRAGRGSGQSFIY